MAAFVLAAVDCCADLGSSGALLGAILDAFSAVVFGGTICAGLEAVVLVVVVALLFY